MNSLKEAFSMKNMLKNLNFFGELNLGLILTAVGIVYFKNPNHFAFGGTLTGPVIVTDKALTATTTSNSGNSGSNGSNSNGGSQNPATGANDIVGVAAALVVITGVSAAAISLKKD